MAALSWSELVHLNDGWAHPRSKPTSTHRYKSSGTPGHGKPYKNYLFNAYDHHASPIALQKTASGRRTKTLDDLQMKYSIADSRDSMAGRRSQRCETAMSVKSTTDQSVHQRNLGKRLFEEAVDRATTAGSVEPSLTAKSLGSFPSLSTDGSRGSNRTTPSYAAADIGHKRQKHNGPTAAGSPLYNKQDSELYTINSERSMTRSREDNTDCVAGLKRQMTRITSEFKVVPTNSTSTLNGGFISQDYLLIPLKPDQNQNLKNIPIMSRSMMEGFRYKQSERNGSRGAKKFISDLLSTGSDMAMSEASENQQIVVPEVTIQTNNVKFSQDKNVKKKPSLNEEQSKQLKPSNTAQNGLLTVETSRSRPSSACSSRSSRSGARSPSRSRPCWVDDASVTSRREMEGDDQPEDTPDPPVGPGAAACQTVVDGVNNLQLNNPDNYAMNCQEDDTPLGTHQEKPVLSLCDLQTQKLSLPDFICPSSEEKSRQAAVREWIENSSFPWALRTVPLL